MLYRTATIANEKELRSCFCTTVLHCRPNPQFAKIMCFCTYKSIVGTVLQQQSPGLCNVLCITSLKDHVKNPTSTPFRVTFHVIFASRSTFSNHVDQDKRGFITPRLGRLKMTQVSLGRLPSFAPSPDFIAHHSDHSVHK